MNDKEICIIITFISTTAAMDAEEYLKEHSVPGRIIPLPGSISAGCGLAWRISGSEYSKQDIRGIVNQLDGIDGIHSLTMPLS